MKHNPKLWLRLVQLLTLLSLFIPATALFAQDEQTSAAPQMALLGGMIFVILLVAAVCYVYISLALQTIAKKTNAENPWMAWIPIVNIVLMLTIAKKPIWWIILCFIPFVNIVIMIIIWMGIAEARQKPNWWGILMIVPGVNFIVPGYLAWSE